VVSFFDLISIRALKKRKPDIDRVPEKMRAKDFAIMHLTWRLLMPEAHAPVMSASEIEACNNDIFIFHAPANSGAHLQMRVLQAHLVCLW